MFFKLFINKEIIMKLKTSDVINDIMVQKGFKRKREIANYFGVSPQALSLWISKDKIPPKHLLKISREKNMKEASLLTKPHFDISQNKEEQKTVIDYLMRENVALKEKLKVLENQNDKRSIIPDGDLYNRIMADSLLIEGRVSDGIITQIEGNWLELMGYRKEQLIGLRYDREDLIHSDELKKIQKIQETLKKSQSISQSKYSVIQRWKHGKTNNYIMLSMVWEVDIIKDTAIILSKPIDGVISD